MKTKAQTSLSEDKQQTFAQAKKLEWWTIFFLLTITVVVFFAMGSSQAMKTAWIEDVLSLVPPISFLIAMRIRDRSPSARFPYGFHRVTMLSFLVAAVAILGLGLYMVYDAASALITQHHPSFGHFSLFGSTFQVWSGWVMIAAMIYSVIPPLILGRMKLPLAKEVHEKTLYADAEMNKADWMTATAAILGVLGVGAGLWWADSVAAGFIALDVTRDGFRNVRRAFADLIGQRPTEVNNDDGLGIEGPVREFLCGQPDVHDAAVRLRGEGYSIAGELYVVFGSGARVEAERCSELRDEVRELDWRLEDLVVVPVSSLDPRQIEDDEEKSCS